MAHPSALAGNNEELLDSLLYLGQLSIENNSSVVDALVKTLGELAEEFGTVLDHPFFEREVPSCFQQRREHRLCVYLAATLDAERDGSFHDHLSLQTLLFWLVDEKESAARCISAAVSSVFACVPRQAVASVFVDERDPMLTARLCYMLVVASQLHALLWISGNAAELLSPHLLLVRPGERSRLIDEALSLEVGAAVRVAVAYASLGAR